MGAIVYSPSVSQDDLTAAAATNFTLMLAQLPTPGTTIPPAVAATSGVTGTTASYARSDHTHATSVQRRRVSVNLTGGVATVTFPTPYDVPPAVNVDVETPTGATSLNLCSVVQGSITTTGFQIAVNKLPMTVTVALGSLTLLTVQTGSVVVNYLAGKPTA